MTDEQLLTLANKLSHALAEHDGYDYPEGHRFDQDASPRSQKFWSQAAVVFELMLATDLHDVLANLGLELPARPERPKGRGR